MESAEPLVWSPTVIDHALRPRNLGALRLFNGHARITGPCGDTMEFWLLVRGQRVEHVSFVTDGCGPSHACGSMATCLANGRHIREAAVIVQQAILDALGGLPEAVEHCALLAARALKAACDDYLLRAPVSQDQPTTGVQRADEE